MARFPPRRSRNWPTTGCSYNRFHTTAVCSPTRAALITGRNHHSAHTGAVTEMATGFPGYDTLLGKDMATIGAMLTLNGYNTAWFGKNHNVADWESSQSGPFDRWPTGLGFEKFYGFIGGVANNWRPALFDGTTPIEPYLGKPDYNLDFDLADQAISWIQMQKTVAPDKPFFVYYATAAGHAPQQATPEWIAKFKGQFDQGWDKMREETFARQKKMGIIPADAKLTPRPKEMPSWDSASPREKKMLCRHDGTRRRASGAGDYNIGRVLKAIDDMGQTDNTLVIFIVGDNGGSGEGSLQGVFNDMNIVTQSEETLDYRREPPPRFRDLEVIQPLPGALGLGDEHAVPVDQAGGQPFRRHAQRHGHILAEGHQGPRRNPLAVPPRHRHRADDSRSRATAPAGRGERRDPASDRRRQHGLHLRRRQGRRPPQDPVFRDLRQFGDLSRRLVRIDHADSGCRGVGSGPTSTC